MAAATAAGGTRDGFDGGAAAADTLTTQGATKRCFPRQLMLSALIALSPPANQFSFLGSESHQLFFSAAERRKPEAFLVEKQICTGGKNNKMCNEF